MNDFIDKFSALGTGQKVMILILVLALIGVGMFVAVLNPLKEKIAQTEAKIQALQREKQSLEELKRNKAKVLAQLEKLESQLLVAQEKLPKDAEIPSLLQRIHNQAKTAGLEIEKFQRTSDTAKDFYVEIPVNMELTGTYDELANFFFYIGRMTRIVNIRDIQMVRKGKSLEATTGDLEVSALATTFRYKKESEMAAKPQKGRRGKK